VESFLIIKKAGLFVKHRRSAKSTKPSSGKQTLNQKIQKNIRAIVRYRNQTDRRRTLPERMSDAITDFSGTILFAVLHVVWFGAWLILNQGWFNFPTFDPFPYGLLTMIVSLEAIFLSTFVLISQNRMSKQDQQRAELDLQINLLTEQELTRVLKMLDEIQDHLGIENDSDHELRELQKETKPEDVMREIEREELSQQEKNPSATPGG
jgi:uncharacterized membrane protein